MDKQFIKTIYFDQSTNRQDEIIKIKTSIIKGFNKFDILEARPSFAKYTKERIKSAFNFFALKFPYGNIKVQTSTNKISNSNLMDLAIAASILAYSGLVKAPKDCLILGEFTMNGQVLELENPYRVLKAAIENKVKKIIIPKGDYKFDLDGKLIEIIYVENLRDLTNYLNKKKRIEAGKRQAFIEELKLDLNDIVDQPVLIRALIIAIAGNHNILIKGPIGSGKSMSVEALKSVLPCLSNLEALDKSSLYTDYYKEDTFINRRDILDINLATGLNEIKNTKNRLGLESLFNNSYILLDEINLFKPSLLNYFKILLNEDYSQGKRFSLIALMNPCPCGNFGTNNKCTCSLGQIERHNRKIDKSLLDRFDMKLNIDLPSVYSNKKENIYDLTNIRRDINDVINIQNKRYKSKYKNNGNLDSKDIGEFIILSDAGKRFINNLAENKKLSRRTINNIIKVARTIADFNKSKAIDVKYLYEAYSYQIEG